MNIRTAERRDLSAMLDIYNYEVKNGTATFDVEPRAGAAGEAWFAAHNTGNHPLLVAEEDGKVLGYASLSPYRGRFRHRGRQRGQRPPAREIRLHLLRHPA